MTPHPTLRILWLLAAAATLPAVGWTAQLLLLAMAALLASRIDALPHFLRALWRIRWLLASLTVVYLWFPPGRLPTILPQLDGLARGASHAVYLASLVAMVELVRRTTPTQELAAALVTLLAPFKCVGLAVDAFARRLALTLELVTESAESVRTAVRDSRGGGRVARWSETAANLVAAVEGRAGDAPPAVALPRLRPLAATDLLWALAAAGTLAILVSV